MDWEERWYGGYDEMHLGVTIAELNDLYFSFLQEISCKLYMSCVEVDDLTLVTGSKRCVTSISYNEYVI